MCEMLLRVVDKINLNDPYLDVKCLKRGDVVVICDDGWEWGSEDLRNPAWRILKLPNVSKSMAEAFLGPELDTDPANPSRMLQRRAFKFDVDNASLPLPIKAWLADVSRANPSFTAGLSAAQLLSFRAAKPRKQDPNVLGK